MLPASQLDDGISRAGFGIAAHATWDMDRELEEWLAIVDDPARVEPIRTVVCTLAEAGRTAGIGLSVKDGRVVFFHRWRFAESNETPRRALNTELILTHDVVADGDVHSERVLAGGDRRRPAWCKGGARHCHLWHWRKRRILGHPGDAAEA